LLFARKLKGSKVLGHLCGLSLSRKIGLALPDLHQRGMLWRKGGNKKRMDIWGEADVQVKLCKSKKGAEFKRKRGKPSTVDNHRTGDRAEVKRRS